MSETEIQDKIIICCDCGQEFTFTIGEAEFYISKGFTQPRRCKLCRQELKLKKRREDERRAGVEVQHE